MEMAAPANMTRKTNSRRGGADAPRGPARRQRRVDMRSGGRGGMASTIPRRWRQPGAPRVEAARRRERHCRCRRCAVSHRARLVPPSTATTAGKTLPSPIGQRGSCRASHEDHSEQRLLQRRSTYASNCSRNQAMHDRQHKVYCKNCHAKIINIEAWTRKRTLSNVTARPPPLFMGWGFSIGEANGHPG